MTGEFKPRVSEVRRADGTITWTDAEMMERWREYCEALYRDEAVDASADIPTVSVTEEEQESDILIEEVRAAIKATKNGKAPGHDGVEAELLKALGEDAVIAIWKICREIWNTKQWPEDWCKSILIRIPKKGDTRN